MTADGSVNTQVKIDAIDVHGQVFPFVESFHGLRYQTADVCLLVRAHAQALHKPVQGDNDAWQTGFLMLAFP